VETFYANCREGVSELEAVSSVHTALASKGAATPDFTLLFGRRTALPHGSASGQRLAEGDVAYTELAGWAEGYAAGLARTAVLGRNREAEELMAIAEEAQQAALHAVRPGAITGDVDGACRGVVERTGRGATFRHRTGYGIGIGWYERGNISLEPNGQDVIEAGMTFHMPTILIEEGRFGVGCSETVLVTGDGVEVISKLDRRIHFS
jgi:Xaa-Pro dipeptidase